MTIDKSSLAVVKLNTGRKHSLLNRALKHSPVVVVNCIVFIRIEDLRLLRLSITAVGDLKKKKHLKGTGHYW